MAVATPTHETLTCPVCLQFYRAPKVLPCMHIFCQRCLQTVALQSDSRKLKCPTCKTRAAIPEGGVADFPSNVFIADELERLEKNNEKKPEKCATHKTEIALFVCAQCDAAVCSECRITEHRDHHVEDLEDAINWTKNELQDGMVRLVDCKRALDSVMGKACVE
ncbi:hypothetical protein BaRGS_00004681 [Batillaria attramentaria]|uniref:Uncharacterized protein n=1 Tax=Batillaria attramentaria TaxID=370345 RepID=A0ABD0LY41_9CAEN